MIRALLAKKQESGAALVSVMAALRMRGGWERLLLPAFIFFFRLLYPFHLANGPGRRVAAAAGGCVLLETSVLAQIGGFEAIRGALIDDCALARAVKDTAGHRTWIGVSRGAESHRAYPTLGVVWRMVARTAYTQLRYSPVLLLVCTLLMALMFWAPIAGPRRAARSANRRRRRARWYGGLLPADAPLLPPLSAWALTMPLIGTLFLAMTWHSAAAPLGRPTERMEGPRLRAGA